MVKRILKDHQLLTGGDRPGYPSFTSKTRPFEGLAPLFSEVQNTATMSRSKSQFHSPPRNKTTLGLI